MVAALSLWLFVVVGCSSTPKLRFDLPDGWTQESTRNGQVMLVQEQRRMSLMLSSLSDSATVAKYRLPGVTIEEAIQQTLVQVHGPMLLPQPPVQALEVQPIPGSTDPARYFTGETAEGRALAVGLMWLDGVEVTMLGSAPTLQDVDELLTVMASVRTGAKVR